MKSSTAFFLLVGSILLSLSGCASDKQMGLCTELGTCTEDPDEKAAAAEKKWWCEYYGWKNCGGDDSAPAPTPSPVRHGGDAGNLSAPDSSGGE